MVGAAKVIIETVVRTQISLNLKYSMQDKHKNCRSNGEMLELPFPFLFSE